MLCLLSKHKAYGIHQITFSYIEKNSERGGQEQTAREGLPAPLGPIIAVNLLNGPITWNPL